MITDALLAPLLAAVDMIIGWLPAGQALDLPNIDAVWNAIATLDSLIPIIGPLMVMLGLLAVGVVFVIVRLALTVWNLIYP